MSSGLQADLAVEREAAGLVGLDQRLRVPHADRLPARPARDQGPARRKPVARDELEIGEERPASPGLAPRDGDGSHALAAHYIGDPGLAELAHPDSLAEATGVPAERGCGGAGVNAAGAVPLGGGGDQGHPALRGEDGGHAAPGPLLLLLGCACGGGALDAVRPGAGAQQRLAGLLQQGPVVRPEADSSQALCAVPLAPRETVRRRNAIGALPHLQIGLGAVEEVVGYLRAAEFADLIRPVRVQPVVGDAVAVVVEGPITG